LVTAPDVVVVDVANYFRCSEALCSVVKFNIIKGAQVSEVTPLKGFASVGCWVTEGVVDTGLVVEGR